MKKILLGLLSLFSIFLLSLLFRPKVDIALATQPEQCNNVTTYSYYNLEDKHSDEGQLVNDSRVNITLSDFRTPSGSGNDGFYKISVDAKTGYQVTSVKLSVDHDGHSDLYEYATGDISNFDPPFTGSGNDSNRITEVKVQVKKVCGKVNICHKDGQSGNFSAIRVDDNGGVWEGHSTHVNDFLYTGPVGENQQPTTNSWCGNNQPGDVCSNIDGKQTEIPAGRVRGENNSCIYPPAQSCPLTCHVDTVMVPDGNGDQIPCPGNAPAAITCSEACGQAEVTGPDGACSTKTCPATNSCAVDQCLNTEVFDETVPEGQYRDQNGNCFDKTPICNDRRATNYQGLTETTYADDNLCTYDSRSYCRNGQTVIIPDNEKPQEGDVEGACATSVPTAVPTPEPGAGQQSKTSISDPICDGSNFDARIQLSLDGKAMKDVQVKFVYHGEAKFAKTGEDGWAGVAYGYRDESNVEFYPEQGYPTQLQKVVLSANCKAPTVLGATTTGKVLGATTLAKTGVVEDMLINMIGFVGATLTAAGTLLYAKKRN